jgi:inosose dehydratase
MKAKPGIAPIAWWNEDLAELGDDASLDFEPVVKALAAKGSQRWFVVEAEQDPQVSSHLEMAQTGQKELLRVMAAAGCEVAP